MPTTVDFIAHTSSGIERGVRNPTVLIIDKIAKALKVPAGCGYSGGMRRALAVCSLSRWKLLR